MVESTLHECSKKVWMRRSMRRCLKRRNHHGGANAARVEAVPLPLARVSQQSLAPET